MRSDGSSEKASRAPRLPAPSESLTSRSTRSTLNEETAEFLEAVARLGEASGLVLHRYQVAMLRAMDAIGEFGYRLEQATYRYQSSRAKDVTPSEQGQAKSESPSRTDTKLLPSNSSVVSSVDLARGESSTVYVTSRTSTPTPRDQSPDSSTSNPDQDSLTDG